MNIFVAKLNYDSTEGAVRSAFEAFGEVESVKIIIDRETDRSKGFGFVEMPNDEEAQSAIEALNDSELDGRTIVVKEARPREARGGDRRGGYDRRPRRDGGFRRDDRGPRDDYRRRD